MRSNVGKILPEGRLYRLLGLTLSFGAGLWFSACGVKKPPIAPLDPMMQSVSDVDTHNNRIKTEIKNSRSNSTTSSIPESN